MLSQAKMVKIKKNIEKLYTGVCTITEHQKVQNENKSTSFEDVIVQRDIPCRLSFKNINKTSQDENLASEVSQITKLFITPEIQLKPGSKLSVTQNGVTVEYQSSGEPAVYRTHQEIVLELFRGWT